MNGYECRASASGSLTIGPAYLHNLVSHLAVIPAQKARDLLDREAAQEHVPQLAWLRIRPLLAGVADLA